MRRIRAGLADTRVGLDQKLTVYGVVPICSSLLSSRNFAYSIELERDTVQTGLALSHIGSRALLYDNHNKLESVVRT